MPIKRLADRVAPAFPCIGKLRKGDKRPEDGKGAGKELPYWRFTSDNPAVVKAFTEAYGEQPTKLDVYLPFKAVTDNWGAWQEEWVSGGLIHRCDGETCVLWLQGNGTYSQEPKPCPGKCTPMGRLSVILPGLILRGHVGSVTMETGSINDILSIEACIRAIVDARGTEDLRGVGFILRRVQQAISTPGDNGKRVRRKHWMVKLEPAAEWVTAQLEAARTTALALPAGISVDDEDADTDEGDGDEWGEPILDGEAVAIDTPEPEAPKPAEVVPAPHRHTAPVNLSGADWTKAEGAKEWFEEWVTKQGQNPADFYKFLGIGSFAELPISKADAQKQLGSYMKAKASA
jgi:hypothetical protein